MLSVVKPRLRGWLHAGMAPLALAAGIVLICLASTPAGVIGGSVFLAASVLLFGTSGIYHRGTWGARGHAVLRRMDHANIYVFIAATYTPLALILLDGVSRVILLSCRLGCRCRWVVLPAVLAIGAALALHSALYRHGLDCAWLARSLLSRCRACSADLDNGGRHLLHPRRGGLRPTASQPLSLPGSVSTRSFTSARSPVSCVTTSRYR